MRKRLKYFIVVAVVFLGIFMSTYGGLKLKNFRNSQRQLGIQIRQLNSQVRQLSNQVNLILEQTYLRRLEDREPQGSYFVFVGHIYPFNGYKTSDKRHFIGNDGKTIISFLSEMNRLNPKRVVFGGDNTINGDRNKLLYLRDNIVGALTSTSSLVLGNHDLSGGSNGQGVMSQLKLFELLYQKPFYFEDVDRIRLIYLNSITIEGKYSLEKEQLQFLSNALSSKGYDIALVFLHHGLWLAGSEYVNAGYPEADEVLSLWKKRILPLFVQGKVKAVFAGDGGVRHQTLITNLEGIPHFLTGWSFNAQKRPADFLRIEVVDDEINVYRYVILNNQVYRVPIEEIIP